MTALSAPTPLPPSMLAASPTPASAADLARGKAKEAGDKFETQFLSQMLGQMFQGLKTDGPFGGGFGEEMFRSVMADAMAGQMTRAGGVGVSAVVQREILKLQGLS